MKHTLPLALLGILLGLGSLWWIQDRRPTVSVVPDAELSENGLARQPESDVEGIERSSVEAQDPAPDPEPMETGGIVSGRLLRESGPWTPEFLPGPGEVVLELLQGSSKRRLSVTSLLAADGRRELSFEARDLPLVEHKLRIWDGAGRLWSPGELRVHPPARNLEFHWLDGDRGVPVVFEVRDARTGEILSGVEGAHVRTVPAPEGGLALGVHNLMDSRFPQDARFEWSVWAGDHAAAFGSQQDLVFEGTRWYGQVQLEEGWSTRILVHDPEGRPVPGASVRIDGAAVGSTGLGGSLSVHLDSEPGQVDVTAPGLHLPGNPLTRGRRAQPERRGHVLLVGLEARNE